MIYKPGNMRQKHVKLLLIGIILILSAIIGGVFLNFRYTTTPVEEPIRPAETGAAFSISRFEHTAMREGEKDWTLNADTARLFSEVQRVELDDMKAVFLLENGGEVTIHADDGEMNMISKNIRAWGNVIVSHPEYTLKTESLNYRYDSRIMIIDTPLEITGNAILFTADSARYEMETETLTFEGNIESWINENVTR
jgi:LPS export ABC transporter protein LptC